MSGNIGELEGTCAFAVQKNARIANLKEKIVSIYIDVKREEQRGWLRWANAYEWPVEGDMRSDDGHAGMRALFA